MPAVIPPHTESRMVSTEKYIKKPLYVDAVQVTSANFAEIAKWCQGEIRTIEGDMTVLPNETGIDPSKQYIKVRVHTPKNVRQTKAFVGDWLLYTERGYKVYTNKAFHGSFDQVSNTVARTQVAIEDPANGKRVLSEAEQHKMAPEELRALIQSGEVVLAQDIAQA